MIGAPDDFSFEMRQDLRQGLVESRRLIGSVGEELFSRTDTSRTVLQAAGCRRRDPEYRQDERWREAANPGVYDNVALLAFDLLARIIAMRIDAGPPFFSALHLWLSMMAAVGLASRSPRSRHSA